MSGHPPRLHVELIACRPAHAAGEWQITWRVTNQTERALHLAEAWVPHGRFRGQGRLTLDRQLAPAEATELELTVYAKEAPRTVVENAFLILRVDDWRVFTRMRIAFDEQAEPTPIVEVVTTQKLG